MVDDNFYREHREGEKEGDPDVNDNPNESALTDGQEFELADELPDELVYDEWPDDLTEADQEPEPSRVRKLLKLRITSAFVVLFFVCFILANFFSVITIPAMGFLRESRTLNSDPDLQSLQQAVVQVLKVNYTNVAVSSDLWQTGTGFNINPSGLIVTNRHVVEDADAISVTFEDGIVYHAASWVWSDQMDIALIYLDLKEDGDAPGSGALSVVELREDGLPEIGAEILMMGNPLGIRSVMNKGKITGYYRDSGSAEPIVEVEAPIYPGSSGSPVFDTEYKVVAVVFAVLLEDEAGEEGEETKRKGLAVPVTYLQRFLIGNEESGMRN